MDSLRRSGSAIGEPQQNCNNKHDEKNILNSHEDYTGVTLQRTIRTFFIVGGAQAVARQLDRFRDKMSGQTAPMKASRSNLVLTAILAMLASGQSPVGSASPAFEAASIKPAGPSSPFGTHGGPGTSDPGRITFGRIQVTSLIAQAWDVQFDQIVGPEWFRKLGPADAFTITATMAPSTSKSQFQLMLRNLLADRFQLRLHHETKNLPGYELTLAAGGPKFKETTQDLTLPQPDIPPPPSMGADGRPKLAAGPGMLTGSGRGTQRVQVQAKAMSEFVPAVGLMIRDAVGDDRGTPAPRVADKTGLTGKYDFAVEFDCRGCQGLSALLRGANLPLLAGRGGPESSPDEASVPGSGLPNIFTAFEKQLGLKLVKTKDVPVDILVVDHIERVPAAN